jgi:hypothetical protein
VSQTESTQAREVENVCDTPSLTVAATTFLQYVHSISWFKLQFEFGSAGLLLCAGQLRVELATWWEADAELEALLSLAARVCYFVLGGADGPSSLTTSLSATAELLESWIDATTTNGVCWVARSALVATVLHFPKLDTDLEVLESRCSAGLMEDEADALYSRVCTTSDSLASHIPSSVGRNPPDSMGELSW